MWQKQWKIKQRERDCARHNAQTAHEREIKLDWPVLH